jgi:hypothetical protein
LANLEASECSLEHFRGSAKGLREALQRGFFMGIKMACFNMIKNLEDYRVTLDRC